jgi:hypothetical protein
MRVSVLDVRPKGKAATRICRRNGRVHRGGVGGGVDREVTIAGTSRASSGSRARRQIVVFRAATRGVRAKRPVSMVRNMRALSCEERNTVRLSPRMRDSNCPAQVAQSKEAKRDSEFLSLLQGAGFSVLVTVDKSIQNQQNV